MKHYLRFGDLPKGRSKIGESYRHHVRVRTGVDLPTHEKGISVFRTYHSDILNRWVLPEEHGTAASASELYAAAESGEMKILLVTGRKVGEGSDGEPILSYKTAKVVKTLSLNEVWDEAGGIELEWDERESPADRSRRLRNLQQQLIDEARRKL